MQESTPHVFENAERYDRCRALSCELALPARVRARDALPRQPKLVVGHRQLFRAGEPFLEISIEGRELDE